MTCNDSDCCLSKKAVKELKMVLYIVFAINAIMFFVELIGGLLANSNALVADSLDMLGDAFIYGLSLFVLTKSHKTQAKASVIKGLVMLLLGLYVFWEAFLKFLNPILPEAKTITILGILAIIANLICFVILSRNKNKNINMQSAWICSRNDIYGNIGVILAGILVHLFNSQWPDIIIGLIIASIVIYFSIQVIKSGIKHSN